jgi:dihydrofolate synthase/folylpolyglutamate synthase
MTNLPFQEALDYLYSFVDYSRERSDRYSAEAFDLARMADLMTRLGEPQLGYPTVHVAGTKGKGSVSAMIASAMTKAGYRTGLYTSPHLVQFTERIQVDGEQISPESVVDITNRLREHVPHVPGLTTFELVTALGFMHFALCQVDCAIVEVGLGGRLDATNVVHPLVTVITSISLDHTHLLGETLGEIAGEKAGILKSGVPLVLSPQPPEARESILARAQEVDSPVVEIGRDWLVQGRSQDLDGQSLVITTPENPMREFELRIPLLGQHQVENAGAAYAALDLLRRRGLPVEDEDIRRGFADVFWPGRFQILSRRPDVVVDAAHNAESARRLAETVRSVYPGRPVTLIFGASADKDLGGMLVELAPIADRIIFTQAFHPRAEDPQALQSLAAGMGFLGECAVSVLDALQTALAGAGPETVALATGSLFVVGEILGAEESQWTASRRSEKGKPAS